MSPLFVQAFVYLFCAVIAVPVSKRLGLSSVLGYLIAGMLIGPFVFGLIGEEGESVMHFAEFGVVMMLFLIGLELQPAMLWKMRTPILGLGGGQVLLTTGCFMACSLLIGLNWQVSLAIGLSLALSSTAIVMQFLQEKGLSNTSGGRSSFAVLLFQDIAVIPILAAFPLLATFDLKEASHGHGNLNSFQTWLNHQPTWMTALLVLAAVLFIIIGGRLLLRPILRWVASTRVREAFVGLALLLVIGIALLMNNLGVSAALGTFLAGVVLADSEYRHELEADIEPFKGLLLGVFFISVGASIDFSLILGNPALIAAIVIGLVVIKFLVLFVLGRFWKLKLDQRFLFSFGLAQGGEFAFVLLGFGLTEGVFPLTIVQTLTASVAVSMALTPLIMIVNEKILSPRFGTKEAEELEPDTMDEDAPVILAGMGRFGNFVARVLMQEGIQTTVIDNDSDHIDMLRRYGLKAFYGDATRHDLLESAGAGKAKLLVIAMDDEEHTHRLIETVHKHFPHLKILARALSMDHQYQLIGMGAETVVHQNSGSAINLATDALIHLGYRSHRAIRAAKTFTNQEAQRINQLASVHHDEKVYIDAVRSHVRELEQQFEKGHSNTSRVEDLAWDTEQLREDLLKSDPLSEDTRN